MVVDVSNKGQGRLSAVLCSGGLDSAVLLAHEAQNYSVQPLYIKSGLAWETVEQEYLDQLLTTSLYSENTKSSIVLECSLSDLYKPRHWALSGRAPAYNTPDEDVYLVGRNVLLFAKAAVYCAVNKIHRLVAGSLAGNPFPDATPNFLQLMGKALSAGLDHHLEIATPFSLLTKAEVIKIGDAYGVPWEHSLSCMSPTGELHCGRCSKCRERLQAFQAANLTDTAKYAFHPLDVLTGK